MNDHLALAHSPHEALVLPSARRRPNVDLSTLGNAPLKREGLSRHLHLIPVFPFPGTLTQRFNLVNHHSPGTCMPCRACPPWPWLLSRRRWSACVWTPPSRLQAACYLHWTPLRSRLKAWNARFEGVCPASCLQIHPTPSMPASSRLSCRRCLA